MYWSIFIIFTAIFLSLFAIESVQQHFAYYMLRSSRKKCESNKSGDTWGLTKIALTCIAQA